MNTSKYGDFNIQSLVGEVLTHIDVFDNNNDDYILLTTESGRTIKIYHEQDCCESVSIEDTEGNWKDLIGKVIVEVDEDIETGFGDISDSWTKTNLTFKVNDATVISRWIGTSNGYYSESVDFEELT